MISLSRIIKFWKTDAGYPALIRKTIWIVPPKFLHSNDQLTGDEHLSGYVVIGADHPLYEIDYDDVDYLEVHKGLSYSDNHLPTEESYPDKWFFGFDCAHCGDCIEEQNEEYVTSQCELLALQLKNLCK